MKICQIIYSFSPFTVGGADIYVKNICEKLVENGHEVVVITTKPFSGIHSFVPSSDDDHNLKIYRFYPANIYFWPNSPKKSIISRIIWSALDTYNICSYSIIRNILLKEKPDIVHLHTPVGFSLSAVDAIKSLNIPIVFTLHEYYFLCKRTTLMHSKTGICTNPGIICRQYQKFGKYILDRKLDCVISPSRFALDRLVRYGFFEKSKKIVLPNGIETPIKPIEKIDNDYIDILYIGAIAEHKGIHLLVNAFRQVKDEKLRLHIAGKGPLLDELKRNAEKDNRINFYGWISEEKKDLLLRLADISVLPSIWYENFPVSIQENFGYSTPVIGSMIGGIPELIKDGYNGFLFEPGNVIELKRILEDLTKPDARLIEMGTNAFESSRTFDIKKHVNELENIYESTFK